jgi:hypothetical protein
VEIEPLGTPIVLLSTHLEAGVWYEIQTANLTSRPFSVGSPDTILSIRNGVLASAETVAGADGCQTPGAEVDERRSCVRFQVDAARYPSGLNAGIWVRAFDEASAGGTDVRMQAVAGADAVPGEDWTTLAVNRSFGGAVVSNVGEGAEGPVRFETTLLPASDDVAYHQLLIIPGGNDDPNENWRISSASRGPGSHRRDIDGTAEWTGLGRTAGLSASSAVVAGNTFPAAAPIRQPVIEN